MRRFHIPSEGSALAPVIVAIVVNLVALGAMLGILYVAVLIVRMAWGS